MNVNLCVQIHQIVTGIVTILNQVIVHCTEQIEILIRYMHINHNLSIKDVQRESMYRMQREWIEENKNSTSNVR